MNKYNVGDVFTDDEFYTDRAIFCNENGYYIDEIEPLNNVRRFQICAPTPKSDAELEAEQIGAEISGLDQQLKEIEDQIIKAIALGDDELLSELQAMYRELLEEAE